MDNRKQLQAISVAAVIVTRNRRTLLEKCINALRAQTQKVDSIIVVDNDSSDGTRQWLRNQPDLILIENSNVGGAGGFACGIDYAVQQHYRWIWCMDDDGRPALDAFEKLRPYLRAEFTAVNSMVLPGPNAKKTTFSLLKIQPNKKPRLFDGKINEVEKIKKWAGEKGYVYYGSLLNGTFLHRESVIQAGNIEPGFFIRGDEVDFLWRLWRVGPVITIPESVHFHPLTKPVSTPPWKLYYGLRNHIVINNRYMNYPLIRNTLIIIGYFFLFSRASAPVRFYLQAIKDGLKGRVVAKVKP